MEKDRLREYLFKEVALCQDIIRRMAGISFLVKGWTLTLVVAVMLLKGPGSQSYLAFMPLLLFWFLDGYFLRQERLYRKLYEWIIANRADSEEHLLDMNTSRFVSQVPSVPMTIVSVTLGAFYGGIAGLVVVFMIFAG